MSSVVVIGATGNIGRSAAFAFLQQKDVDKVFIVGREASKLESLKNDYLGGDKRVIAIVADVTSATGADSAAKLVLEQTKSGDHLVSSSGPWWTTPALHETPAEKVEEAFQSNIFAHFNVWRSFAKHVRSSYVIVNGAAKSGLPGTGLTGICANALHGFAVVAQSEAARLNGLRVHEFLIASRVADGEGPHAVPTKKFGKFFVSIANGVVTKESGQVLGNAETIARFA